MNVSPLRLARLQRGLTLDEISFRTRGRLRPGRLSRIERGYATPTAEEALMIRRLFGIDCMLGEKQKPLKRPSEAAASRQVAVAT
jgi:transcriptional regulator with XRE-family HTH domain